MNTKLYVLLLAAIFALALQSCVKENASDVNQDRIYVEYELFYNANTDITTASAHFKFGSAVGTTLQLDSTATVTFNGNNLAYNAVLGRHEKEYAGKLDSGTFVYTNIDGTVFTNNTLPLRPIAFPPIDTIHRNAAFTLNWVGDPLITGESVGLSINGQTQGDIQLFAETSIGANNTILSKTKLAKLGLGPATMIMDRSYTLPVPDGTSAGGTVSSKFRANNVTVQVGD